MTLCVSLLSGRWRIALAAVLMMASLGPLAQSQSLGGATGLIFVPTARTQADGVLAIGTGYVPDTYSVYTLTDSPEAAVAYVPTYASVSFLPAVEVGFRFSRAVDTGVPQALGDRMLFARVRVLEERGALPALAVGAHDFLRSTSNQTNQFAALYGVASKQVDLSGLRVVQNADVHVGLGTDWLQGKNNQFVGPFGGVALAFVDAETGILRRVVSLAEYDGRTVNVGQRLGLGAGVDLTAALQGLDAFTFGVAARHRL